MSSSPIPSVDAKATQDALASITAAIPSKLSHFTLENGLSVYLREDHSTPIVAVQLWYHVGTSHEPPGHTNLSHLLEHLLFEGSSKLPAGQYSRVIALLGGKANATTHDDATAFDILLPANRLPMALEIMADAMSSATLDQAQFEHEIKSIEDERRLKYENSTYFQHLDRHEALAYAGSPYGEPTFGHALDLSEMQWASVHAWYRTWYVPNNATLVVVGATDLPALRRQVEAHFAAIPRGPLPEKATLRFSGEMRERSQVLEDESPQEAVHLSFNVPSQASASSVHTTFALRLLIELLGEGFSSRFYSRLVRDQRLLTYIQISYEHLHRGDTLLTVSALCNKDLATPQQAAQAIWEQIDELRGSPLPEQELESAKLRLLTKQLYNSSKHELQAEGIGQTAAAGLDPMLIDLGAKIIRDLTVTTVQQVAIEYLRRERLTITCIQQGEAA
ncbi:MAG: insulinase family protein [Paucimonas sp.]|jgi:zinc protease|nr:insulinase family protein [Paucimonas sp.]